jgi:hypothetical protein
MAVKAVKGDGGGDGRVVVMVTGRGQKKHCRPKFDTFDFKSVCPPKGRFKSIHTSRQKSPGGSQ